MNFIKSIENNVGLRVLAISLLFVATLLVTSGAVAEPVTEQYVNETLSELASKQSEAVFVSQYLPEEFNLAAMATFMAEYVMTYSPKPIFMGIYGQTSPESLAQAINLSTEGMIQAYRGRVASWPNVTIVYFSDTTPGKALQIAISNAGMVLLVENLNDRD